jgi:probable HAF family extracellular repeat protein
MRSFLDVLLVSAAVVFVAWAVAPVAMAVVPYYVTDVGQLPGGKYGSSAAAVNDAGQVVGTSDSAVGGGRAFLYGSGTMIDIGTLPGGTGARPYAISSNGSVTGYSESAGGERAFLWQNGTMINLGVLPGDFLTTGYGVNDSGQVVGYSDGQRFRAFLYSNGTMIDLSVGLDTYSVAYAINNAGQVVGAGYQNHGFLYSNGTMTQLGVLPGFTASAANAISADGKIAGLCAVGSGSSYVQHAFLYVNGAMTDLGTFGSYDGKSFGVSGVNDRGQVVGNSDIDSRNQHGFLYSGGTTFDINSLIAPNSGWTIEYASGINNFGWIAAGGYNGDGRTHALLLKPALPGDANLDGVVDISDLTRVLTNYDKTGMAWAQGDFDGSGTVDIADLSALLTNFDKTAAASSPAVALVPEPAGVLLVAIAGMGLLGWRRRLMRAS